MGLICFILFSTVGHSDEYEYEAPAECYLEECDGWEIVDEEPIETEIPDGRHHNDDGRHHRRHPRHDGRFQPQPYPYPGPAQPPVVLPPTGPYYPAPGGVAYCNVYFVGHSPGGPIYDLRIGGRFVQRGYFGVVRNSAWYFARTGQCSLGNIR